VRKRILLGFALLLLIVAGCSAYVAATAGTELLAAQRAVAVGTLDTSEGSIDVAIRHLEKTQSSLDALPARFLRLFPIAGQNLGAIESVSGRGLDALRSTSGLLDGLERLDRNDLMRAGRVRLDEVGRLHSPLQRQLEALQRLDGALRRHANGWLLPPVWEAVADLRPKVADARATVERAMATVDVAPHMLGASGRRDYLVMLMNNAELRGAGGILSGIGTLSAKDGRFSLGDFSYYADVSSPRSVSAPPDFLRRFARYRANRLWINTTASPDVPEVARVAANLYRAAGGRAIDGAILADPRGLAALIPERREIGSNGVGPIDAKALPEFAYSDAYERFENEGPRRREALLALGPDVLRVALHGGIDRPGLERAAAAMAGGHLRVVSFDDSEHALLTRLDAAGELATGSTDSALVTVQNLGADKLDFWMRRSITHRCSIESESRAVCSTSVELSNDTPRGLPDYVTQAKRPYGRYEGYLEIYVPEEARLRSYSLDGKAVKVFPEPEDGRVSLGAGFSTLPEETTVAEVGYVLPLDPRGYRLEITPQPLSNDASIEVSLRAPETWITRSPESQRNGNLSYRSRLDRTLTLWAAPEEGPPGITRVWDGMRSFWNRTLFRL
jgi:Protein of unknown function (DUF4012)